MTPEKLCWRNMKNRCLNPKSQQFKNYGGRGITVCDRWKDFDAFLSDMGLRPPGKMSIERIDNSKGYYPENCKWGTTSEQAANQRRTVLIDGKPLSVLAREAGEYPSTLFRRLSKARPLFEKKGVFNRGEYNRASKLTAKQVLSIRASFASGGIQQKELALRYGIARSVVSSIILRKTWTHTGS